MSVNSDIVSVFPCVNRKTDIQNSKLLNEKNIVGLLNHVTDSDSYIVEYDEETNKICFVLHGYYFEYELQGSESSSNLYAFLNMSGDVLMGDNNNNFEGLTLKTSIGSDDKDYLQLFVNGNLNEDGKIKFDLSLPKKIVCKNIS